MQKPSWGPPYSWMWALWSSSRWWLQQGKWSRGACRGWDSCSCSTISPPRPVSRRSGLLRVRRSSSRITESRPRTSSRSRRKAARWCFSACSTLDQLLAYTPHYTAHRQAGSECRETPDLRKRNKSTNFSSFSGDFHCISWSFSGNGVW